MFPTTDWGLFESVRGGDSPARKFALETLASRFWRPAFLFIRQHGLESADAEDLTQEFFAAWLAKDTFARADSARGRFQSLLRASHMRFLSNAVRTNRAKRRMPSKGFVSLQKLAEAPGPLVEPFHGETPEALFNCAWAVTLVTCILSQMEKDAEETGKSVHLDIFKRRIVLPLLDGTDTPAMRKLAERHGLDEKQAANAARQEQLDRPPVCGKADADQG